MEFKRQFKRHEDIPDGTPVRFGGVEGVKIDVPNGRHSVHVNVSFGGFVSNIHYEHLETPVETPPAPPEPLKPEYRETKWFLCEKTGDLFYFNSDLGWYICVNNMVPPLHWSEDKEPRVKNLKRLYREA